MSQFASRAGFKLDHALAAFAIDVAGKICADFGCSTGGFTDCLLQREAAKVFAIDTGYGVLDWKLRNDSRVVVMERNNAMHVELPTKVEIVTIDVGWTRQKNILPSAAKVLAPGGIVISLVKPHYEAEAKLLRKGVLPDENVDAVVNEVRREIESLGWDWRESAASPIRGSGGNLEVLVWLARRV
jgi:23S rRNA (cytidine1920-2'-O)/16S rRNA (cytidine1409-2'-O)-methyltransferase